MKRFEAILALAVALALTACAGVFPAVQTGMEVAGATRDAYCSLPAEKRAKFREEHSIPHLIQCPNDPVEVPPHDPG